MTDSIPLNLTEIKSLLRELIQKSVEDILKTTLDEETEKHSLLEI